MDDQRPPAKSNALKRKISWGDNSKDCDRPSIYSKVARSQAGAVWPHDPASNDHRSRSDNDDDNNSNPQYPRGLSDEWTARIQDIHFPAFPSESLQCCVTCKAMMETEGGLSALLDDDGYKHLNWYRIQETAALGCALCTEIWDQTENEDWDCNDDGSVTCEEIRIVAGRSRLPSPAEEGSYTRRPLENIQLHSIHVQIPTDGGFREVIVFHLVTSEADPASDFVPGRRESKDLSLKAVSKIRGWLDNCLEKHPSCPRHGTPELPRRVLDVGINNLPIRLHQSQNNERASYASLSYCWGGQQQLITTTSNISDHMVALPCGLPKTILDAIEVCQKVGIRYLWVDSLCIVQNDDSDKLDQVAKMGLIYKNSTVTIVAASAEKVTDGFLSNGKSNKPTAQLPIFVNNSTFGTVYLRTEHLDHIYSSDEPIFKRAWTFQELLLSPRAIIFDSYQIILKCLEQHYQPVFETYLSFEFDCGNLPVSVFGLVDENIASRKDEESREDYIIRTQDRIWGLIINEYSQRDLTHVDDRLPALAGVAAELAKAWNDIYLAGFWAKTIVQHLGWYHSMHPESIKQSIENIECIKTFGAPSWSWVTTPYSVHIHEVRHTDAKFLGSTIQLISQTSPFGGVKSASISLKARVLKVSDLDLTLNFHDWPSRPYDNNIGLDFKDHKPKLDNCRLIYLGEGRGGNGIFVAVEKFRGGVFRRIGYAQLGKPLLSGQEQRWMSLLSLTRRETIAIE